MGIYAKIKNFLLIILQSQLHVPQTNQNTIVEWAFLISSPKTTLALPPLNLKFSKSKSALAT